MAQPTPTIREAALLISALDSASADLLLDQMEPEQAALVRAAVMDLDEAGGDDFDQLASVFMTGGQGNTVEAETDSVVLELSNAEQVNDSSVNNQPAADAELCSEQAVDPFDELAHEEEAVERSPSFCELASAADHQLLPLLLKERPQVVAVVLARLAPELAARLLSRLPASLQTDVVRRIAQLGPANEAALAEVESMLSESLLRHGLTLNHSPGVQSMQAILEAADPAHRQQIVGNLSQADTDLAGKLDATANAAAQLPASSQASQLLEHQRHVGAFTFDQLAELDGPSLSKVLLASPWKTVLLALAGAEPRLIATIGAHLPAEQRQALTQQIEQQGPIRLRDVELAQERVAEVAAELIAAGEIESPTTPGFVTAA